MDNTIFRLLYESSDETMALCEEVTPKLKLYTEIASAFHVRIQEDTITLLPFL